MKRFLSLFEVVLALALATILLSTLFSTFRYLTKQSMSIEKLRREKHWEYVTRLRLNQVFESIRKHAVFRTEPYGDISTNALHFTFQNGIDLDPLFCGEQEGYLLLKEEDFCFIIEPKNGKNREEIFVKNAKNFSIKFFHPKQKKWIEAWEEEFLPPMVKISLDKQKFFFFPPHANHKVRFS